MRPFALIRPESLTQARDLVVAKPEGRSFRAGGIDLMDRMKEGLDDPELLVELRGVGELAGVTESAGFSPATADGSVPENLPSGALWRVGAATTLAEIAANEALLDGAAALVEAASQAATPGIRNTATVGGNLLQRPRCWYYRNRELVCLKKGGDMCLAIAGDNRYHAILGGGPSFIVHPSSLATALVALGATVGTFRGASAEDAITPGRVLPIEELFAGPKTDPTREHVLEDGEVLEAVLVPKAGAEMRSAYGAVREKQSHDWPLVEAAVRMRVDAGVMKDVRVALGHVAPVPWLSPEAAEVLEGQAPDAELFARAAEAAVAKARPLDGNGYKVPMSKGLLREVLHRASGLALPE
ncbi:molybdopterin dehydrogenase, FAD-binding protein [Plesiocystis pacifica SIR-1]|uniref:Molybdopterin dehydrogenase, FAD-binding protein n=1 Tax=Plesiocystis pacifica SIR-1 TaxID=391625 RepID=A6G0X9_9BACT|nr:FAD binding domain-containing protein [Plesiocystis pacifica]EDM80517.1 molybdopterin dehydrogenase, FAD-binding protein [Plesiocystis pacifica SIR-1]